MAAYLLLVGLITLTPATSEGRGPMWYVMRLLDGFPTTGWVTLSGLELTANVVMFVPLGLLGVPLVGRDRWWWVVVAGFVLTCAIELTQLAVPGRVTDIRDVVANTSGAVIGTLVMLGWWWFRRRGTTPSGSPSLESSS